MKRKRTLKTRVLSMLALTAILLPVVALVAYAGSPAQSFNFTWSGSAGTKYQRGYKTDVGSSSGYYAQANISSTAAFGGSGVAMWVERVSGTHLTSSIYVSSSGSKYMYYYDDAFSSAEAGTTVYMDLSARSSGMVQGFGGTWWP